MRYQAILFDLDGTLLPMELEAFAKIYFGALAKELTPFGLTPEALFKPFWAATKAMMGNTTGKLNADVFWETFSGLTGVAREKVEPICDAFYEHGFQAARAATMENPLAKEAVRIAQEKADKVVLATNPPLPHGWSEDPPELAGPVPGGLRPGYLLHLRPALQAQSCVFRRYLRPA